MADILVTGQEAYFNEDAKFFKDVYIYGNLYAFGEGGINGSGSGNFTGSVTIPENLFVGGISTFVGRANFLSDVNIENLQVGILTVTTKFDIGVNGSTLTASTSNGNIGVNNINPREKLDIVGTTLISDNLGIGLGVGVTFPQQALDVKGSALISSKLGIGVNSPQQSLEVFGTTLISDKLGIGNISPQYPLDVTGDARISSQLYDSTNSSGVIGAFLTKDAQGIKWTPFEPSFVEGIFVYNEGTLVGVNSFRGLNLKKGNNITGISTDNIEGFINPTSPSIADIYIYDYWGTNIDNDIYRNSKVGIGTTFPKFDLDVLGFVGISSFLIVGGATSLASTLDVTGITTLRDRLTVKGPTILEKTLDVTGITTLRDRLVVKKDVEFEFTLDVSGITTLRNQLIVGGASSLASTLLVGSATTLNSTLHVGIGGTVITTTKSGSVGIGTINPIRSIDLAKDVIIRKGLYDSNNNIDYKKEFYQTPRSVLTQVGVDTVGQIIGGRFFDAANMIRLNLDFIAAEAVGYVTSTDYIPSFSLTSENYISRKDNIKDILKAITIDITKGGNVQSVGAGRSYYDGNNLLYINTDTLKSASIAIIGAAATVAKYVINNVSLPKSYQSGVGSIRQVRDLTLQDDAIVGVNISPNGCSNVVSAIYTCAGIVTTIIGNGQNAVSVNNPDGKVIWAPAGADSRNLIWVSKYGNDDNGGNTEGDAKLTIGAACEIAEPGDTVMVRSGVYYENNPIGLRTDVSVSGQDLRLVTVVPKNLGKDIFHVRRGCLIENMNFACETGESNPGGGALAFPPTTTDIVAGKSYGAVTGYLAPGPATEGPSGRWRSPYVRNCTNFMPLSIGMKIDGDHAVSSTIGADLKCMVCDSFTQYNEAGIGVSITNNGYAQLVSIFTINCDKAIYVDTGGQCDLTNSNSSFGNYGLYAVGLGRTEFTAKVNTSTSAEADTIVFKNVKDTALNIRRPYDGQALWFAIDLSNYGTGQTGIITAPLRQLNKIDVINNIPGYSPSAPPDVTIYDYNTNNDNPLGPEGIIAELSPTISDAGELITIDVIGSGRNYLPSQDMRVKINGIPTNDLVAVMEPIYYTVSEATPPTTSGITTVTLNEFVPYLVYANDDIEMRRISRILTSGHSFEYIGTGTDINTSTPLKGAVPIKENEIVALDGAQIPYTSTDQKGNFNIGEGIQVDQTTATIRGRDFAKAIQAQVTPLILALR